MTKIHQRIGWYILILGSIVYFNALFNHFVWDDEEQILNNTIIHSIFNLPTFFAGSTFNTGGATGLAGLYYKPLMTTVFSLLYSIFGNQSFFYHAFQIALHLINSWLVFYILRYFLSKINSQYGTPLAALLSLVFLVHPINTETVVYISALQDTLFFFFGATAFTLAIQYSELNLQKFLRISLLLLLSLLSKETGVLFYPLIGLYFWLFHSKKFFAFLGYSFISLMIYSLLRFVIAGVYFNNHRLSTISRMDLGQRLINVPLILVSYLKTFFYPIDLAISQHWAITKISFGSVLFPLLILTGIVGSLFYLGYKLDKDKRRVFVFFSCWLGGGLLFHSQIVPLDMTVAERWFYFSEVGLLGIIGVILSLFRKKYFNYILYLFSIILILLSVRTFIRTFDWRDGLTLYGHDISISKNAFDLENNYGVELFRIGKFEAAKQYFINSTKLAPYWWTNWNNLGAVYEREQNYPKALEYYLKAVNQGEYYLAYGNAAGILVFHGDAKTAQTFIEFSLQKLPNNPQLWLDLAIADYKLRANQQALIAAKKAYELAPSNQSYYVYTTLQQGRKLPLPN